jgi:hypothetical protein
MGSSGCLSSDAAEDGTGASIDPYLLPPSLLPFLPVLFEQKVLPPLSLEALDDDEGRREEEEAPAEGAGDNRNSNSNNNTPPSEDGIGPDELETMMRQILLAAR